MRHHENVMHHSQDVHSRGKGLTNLESATWQAAQSLSQWGGVHWLVWVLTVFPLGQVTKETHQS